MGSFRFTVQIHKKSAYLLHILQMMGVEVPVASVPVCNLKWKGRWSVIGCGLLFLLKGNVSLGINMDSGKVGRQGRCDASYNAGNGRGH